MSLSPRHSHGDCLTWSPEQAPDPLCRPPDALIAAANTREPWDSNIKYAQITSYILLAILVLAILPGLTHRLRLARPRAVRGFTGRLPGYLPSVCTWRRMAYYHPYPSTPSATTILLISAMTLSLLIWSFSIRPYYRKDAAWGSTPLGLRTGMISNGTLPFLYALALKMNPISWLTGISHERLQVYHQWLARIALLFAWIHSIAFLIDDSRPGPPWEMLKKWWTYSPWCYNTGVAALIAMSWLVLSSTRVVRDAGYQFFYLNHIASNCLFLGFYFAHTDDMMHSWRWLWPVVGVWVGSTLGKWVRSGLFVGRGRVRVGAQRGYLRIEVEVPRRFRARAGQHVFLRFPTLRGWQSHPFTIASDRQEEQDSGTTHRNVLFLIREAKGLIRTLANAVRSKTGGEQILDLPVILDGPYGSTWNLASYDAVLLIAGGAGISFVLPLLQDLARKRGRHDADFFCQRLQLVWAMSAAEGGGREGKPHPLLDWTTGALKQVKDGLIAAPPLQQGRDKPGDEASQTLSVDFDVHLTAPTPGDEAEIEESKSTSDFINLHPTSGTGSTTLPYTLHSPSHRPCLSALVRNFVTEHAATFDDARASPSPSLCVVVCGPHSMAHEVSNNVASLQRRAGGGWPDVQLVREDFHW